MSGENSWYLWEISHFTRCAIYFDLLSTPKSKSNIYKFSMMIINYITNQTKLFPYIKSLSYPLPHLHSHLWLYSVHPSFPLDWHVILCMRPAAKLPRHHASIGHKTQQYTTEYFHLPLPVAVVGFFRPGSHIFHHRRHHHRSSSISFDTV